MDTFSLAGLLDETKKKTFYSTLVQVKEILDNKENGDDIKAQLIEEMKTLLAMHFIKNSYPEFRDRYGVYCVGKEATFSGVLYTTISGLNSIDSVRGAITSRLQDFKDFCVEKKNGGFNFKRIRIALMELESLGILDFLERQGVELQVVMCGCGNLLRDSESEIKVMQDGGTVDSIIIFDNMRSSHGYNQNEAYKFMYEVGHLIHTLIADGDNVPDSFIEMLNRLGANFALAQPNKQVELFCDVFANSCLYGTKAYIEINKNEAQKDLDDKLNNAFKEYFRELCVQDSRDKEE